MSLLQKKKREKNQNKFFGWIFLYCLHIFSLDVNKNSQEITENTVTNETKTKICKTSHKRHNVCWKISIYCDVFFFIVFIVKVQGNMHCGWPKQRTLCQERNGNHNGGSQYVKMQQTKYFDCVYWSDNRKQTMNYCYGLALQSIAGL